MKVIERAWQSGTYSGTTLAYADVEPELLDFKPRIRVLPARWYYEKKLYFELHKRYEPGEHKHFPNGGFHVRDTNGAGYYFELDQVIIHPAIIDHERRRRKIQQRVERQKQSIDKVQRLNEKAASGERGRGRPPLSKEAREQRDAEKKARAIRSGGKRGRPAKGEVREPKVYVPKGTKRGRPSLDPAIKAQREANTLAKQAVSTGKRGRPSNPAKQKEREEEAARRLALNPERRRGRPKR